MHGLKIMISNINLPSYGNHVGPLQAWDQLLQITTLSII